MTGRVYGDTLNVTNAVLKYYHSTKARKITTTKLLKYMTVISRQFRTCES